MALEGDLKLFALPDILQVVSQQQKTGILTVQGEQDILAVSFLRGEIVAADALNQSFEDSLGEVLASQGLLQPDEFARLCEEQSATGERLSDFLQRRGVLSRQQMLEALRVQTYRLLLQVLRWRQGDFKFYSGEEVSFEEGVVPISVEEVLLRSVGDLVGEGTMSGTLPHGFVAYERIDAVRPIRVGTWREEADSSDPDTIWITPEEQIVLDGLDGQRVADQVARETGLGEYKTLYSLFRLLQTGLVRPSGDFLSGQRPEPDPEPAPKPDVESTATAIRLVPLEVEEEEPEAPLDPPYRGARLTQLASVAALLAAVLLVLVAVYRPASLLLPFPGQHAARAAFARQQRIARLDAIDRAARTVYQVEGRYPDGLEPLVTLGLLPAEAVSDPQGIPQRLIPEDETYHLETGPEGEIAERTVTGSVAGDFLLDPAFFSDLRDEVGVPLVLLD